MNYILIHDATIIKYVLYNDTSINKGFESVTKFMTYTLNEREGA